MKPSTHRDNFSAGGGLFSSGKVEVTSIRAAHTDPETYKGIKTPAVFLGITVEGEEEERAPIILTTGKARVKPARDGKSFDSIDPDEEVVYHNSCAWAQFLDSLWECGMDPDKAGDLDSDFTLLVGLKGQLVRQAIERAGLDAKIDSFTGKPREFTKMVFTSVDEWPSGLGGDAPKKTTKPAKPTGGNKGAAPAAEDSGLEADARKILTLMVSTNGDGIDRGELASEVFDCIEKNKKNESWLKNRSKLIKLIGSKEFLEQKAGWDFDGTTVSPAS